MPTHVIAEHLNMTYARILPQNHSQDRPRNVSSPIYVRFFDLDHHERQATGNISVHFLLSRQCAHYSYKIKHGNLKIELFLSPEDDGKVKTMQRTPMIHSEETLTLLPNGHNICLLAILSRRIGLDKFVLDLTRLLFNNVLSVEAFCKLLTERHTREHRR